MGLSQRQLAQLLGVATKIVVHWENELLLPNDCERQALAKALCFEAGFFSLESNNRVRVGNCTPLTMACRQETPVL
jgi:ribosome-binding protein aMBF1 (putative translation factor)